MDVLDLRQLNRATLARQGLLERRQLPVAELVRNVGGLQAQLPAAPLIGLWSRLQDFSREQYRDAVRAGQLVRGTSLRGTLHLHEVDDYRALRMSLQEMLDSLQRTQVKRLGEQPVEPVIDAGRCIFEAGPATVGELKAQLAEQFPGVDPQALGSVPRLALALLLVPDDDARDGWRANNAPIALATDVVGDTLHPPDLERVVRRFFEVLGPGSAKDVQTWSSMRGVKSIVERMLDAGELVGFATWEGEELFDLPDAPRPSSEAIVPPRFLPMWDNLLLSHADRSRVVDPAYKPFIASKNGMPPPTYLIDGFVHGSWRVERAGDAASLLLQPFASIPGAHEDALIAEGESLLEFLEPDASNRRIRVD